MKGYENCKATQKEIEECEGDYYGCEICHHANLCSSLKLAKLLLESDTKTKEEFLNLLNNLCKED